MTDSTVKRAAKGSCPQRLGSAAWLAVLALLLAPTFALAADGPEPQPSPDSWPAQLYFLTPAQIFSDQSSIAGLRLGIFYGRNVDVMGLDVGAGLSHTTRDMLGLSINPVARVDGAVTGLQAGVVSITKGRVAGFQIGGLNKSGDVMGAQLGTVNLARGQVQGLGLGVANVVDGHLSGWQAGVGNTADGRLVGAQTGFANQMGDGVGVQLAAINFADAVTGLQLGSFAFSGEVIGAQIGVANTAEHVTGLQLGLVNVTREMRGIQLGVINVIRKGGWLVMLPLINGSF